MTPNPDNSREEVRALVNYLLGYAAAMGNPRLARAGEWLDKAIDLGDLCSQGYFGCSRSDNCTADHK